MLTIICQAICLPLIGVDSCNSSHSQVCCMPAIHTNVSHLRWFQANPDNLGVSVDFQYFDLIRCRHLRGDSQA
jgi:hypothetical protein